jgi:hypothetical protein
MTDTLIKAPTTYTATIEITTDDGGPVEVLILRNIPAGICGPFDGTTVASFGQAVDWIRSQGFELRDDAAWKLARNGFFHTPVIRAPQGRPAAEMDW